MRINKIAYLPLQTEFYIRCIVNYTRYCLDQFDYEHQLCSDGDRFLR